MPASLGSGVHLPSNMAAGAVHIPTDMGHGVHLPSNMATAAVHIPGSAEHNPRLPGRMALANMGGRARPEIGETAGRPFGGATRQLSLLHPQDLQTPPPHQLTIPGVAQHATERGVAPPHLFATLEGSHVDPRIGGQAALHTSGLPSFTGSATPPEPRRFLQPDPHRDIGRDHVFVASHLNDFHTHQVREFSTRELGDWRRGIWRNEWHYGRHGWWWEVGDVWYAYPDPIYPYPTRVAPLTVYETSRLEGPVPTSQAMASGRLPTDTAVLETADASSTNAAAARSASPVFEPMPLAPRGYYRCMEPHGYFPAVGACSTPWIFVQDAPPDDQP